MTEELARANPLHVVKESRERRYGGRFARKSGETIGKGHRRRLLRTRARGLHDMVRPPGPNDFQITDAFWKNCHRLNGRVRCAWTGCCLPDKKVGNTAMGGDRQYLFAREGQDPPR